MTTDSDLSDLAAHVGIFAEFRTLADRTQPTSPDTQRALLRAEGFDVGSAKEVRAALARVRAEDGARLIPAETVIEAGRPSHLLSQAAGAWMVAREETAEILAEGRAAAGIDLPPLPSGVHLLRLEAAGGEQTCTLIVAPARAPMLGDVAGVDRVWGVVAALYGLQTERNAGLGDFEDLAVLAEILGAQGADFVGINPVHALGWGAPETISPYSPTHRGFLNTAHIALDQVEVTGPDRPAGTLIDYARIIPAHRGALCAAFEKFTQTATASQTSEFDAFVAQGGAALADFARFEHLSTVHGPDWRVWPAAEQATMDDADVRFHQWLQWQADQQLAGTQARAREAGMALGLYLDLAVGARRDGAEAWGAGDTLARGVSLGAPPDHLSPGGQNWQLAAYAPRKLAAQRYTPLRQVLRQAMRHCGLLRIDHVLGLNRSYWVPDDGSPGGYIRQPFQSLMALIAIEAERAGTLIVGEDLGLVPDGFRDTMAARGFYGYTVLQYERTGAGRFRRAADLRPQTLACFGTHDTPTIKGFWTGQDITWWHRLGWIDETAKDAAVEQRKHERADLLGVTPAEAETRSAEDLRDKVHRDLAQGPTTFAAVQLDDLLDAQEAQNLPGTVDTHPNWRRMTQASPAQLAHDDRFKDTADLMTKAGRSDTGPPK